MESLSLKLKRKASRCSPGKRGVLLGICVPHLQSMQLLSRRDADLKCHRSRNGAAPRFHQGLPGHQGWLLCRASTQQRPQQRDLCCRDAYATSVLFSPTNPSTPTSRPGMCTSVCTMKACLCSEMSVNKRIREQLGGNALMIKSHF